MSELSSTTLRIAYCAVKAQLRRGDLEGLWLDLEQRELFAAAEESLREALVAATLAKEEASRGGAKVRDRTKESIMIA